VTERNESLGALGKDWEPAIQSRFFVEGRLSKDEVRRAGSGLLLFEKGRSCQGAGGVSEGTYKERGKLELEGSLEWALVLPVRQKLYTFLGQECFHLTLIEGGRRSQEGITKKKVTTIKRGVGKSTSRSKGLLFLVRESLPWNLERETTEGKTREREKRRQEKDKKGKF